MNDDFCDMTGGPVFCRDLFLLPGRLGRLCKGGGAPRVNKRLEAQQEKLIKAQIAQANQKFEIPEIAVPPPAAPPPPPPVANSADVLDAQVAARRGALRRRSPGRSTIFAGNTGGYKGAMN
jgi:hypothetical protein